MAVILQTCPPRRTDPAGEMCYKLTIVLSNMLQDRLRQARDQRNGTLLGTRADMKLGCLRLSREAREILAKLLLAKYC